MYIDDIHSVIIQCRFLINRCFRETLQESMPVTVLLDLQLLQLLLLLEVENRLRFVPAGGDIPQVLLELLSDLHSPLNVLRVDAVLLAEGFLVPALDIVVE